jgi:hypothetical protein
MTPAANHFPDQPQDPLVCDPVLKELRQPAMVKAGEELAEIRVEHPVHAPRLDRGGERIQRIMRAAPRPKPIRETEEVRLVDGVQNLDERPLKDLVLQRSDTKRPLPPVRLRYEHPPRRLRSVAPALDTGVQIREVALQILPVVLPPHAVHPRRGLWTDRPVGRPQAINIDMVQERREPRFLVLLRHSAHAVQLT